MHLTSEHLRHLNAHLYPGHIITKPKTIVLGVNNVCNLHCKMCDVGTKTEGTNFAQNLIGSHPINMPLPLIKKIIEQTAQYFPKAHLCYAFTEPLVYPHLLESLQYATDNKLHTSITTNALVLESKAEDLVKAGLKQINVSLDGTQDIHNYIRGNEKSFQKAVAGIKKILAFSNHLEVTIVMAITPWNTACIKALADYFRNIPIKAIGFMHTQFADEQSVQTHNNQWGHIYHATVSNITEMNPNDINFSELWNQLEKIKKTKYPFETFFSIDMKSENELRTYYQSPSTFFGKSCQAIFNGMMIKTDGNVIPAHGRCFNLPVGNINNEPLNKIWNSQVFSRLRKDVNKAGGLFPACTRCCSAFQKPFWK